MHAVWRRTEHAFARAWLRRDAATHLLHAVTRSDKKPLLPGHRNPNMPSEKILFLVLHSKIDQERGKWKN